MRKFKVKVDGEEYLVEVEEVSSRVNSVRKTKTEEKIEVKPRPKKKPEAKVSTAAGEGLEVKAPLPGLISAVKIKAGDKVSKGDILFILEAMKMENELTAPADGVVAEVKVSSGVDVDTGQVLAVIK